jgi:hypothetical protein
VTRSNEETDTQLSKSLLVKTIMTYKSMNSRYLIVTCGGGRANDWTAGWGTNRERLHSGLAGGGPAL